MAKDKYYYNGAYLDLDGFPIAEYIKTLSCCCGGGSGDNPEETTKTKNTITVISKLDETNDKVYYKAKSLEPVTTKLLINVKSTTNNVTALDLDIGRNESKEEVGDTLDILSVGINVNEDENYKYVVKIEEGLNKYKIYSKAIRKDRKNDVSVSDLNVSEMSFVDTLDITFDIPPVDEDYNSWEDEEKIQEFIDENQYIFVIAIPNKAYALRKYTISNEGNDIITSKFKIVDNKKDIVNGVEYVYLYEEAEDESSKGGFVPMFKDDEQYPHNYKLSIIM